MHHNFNCIKEYLKCRATYTYKEREAIREALKRNIEKVETNFAELLDLVNDVQD